MCELLQMSGWAGAQSLHAEGGRAVVYTGMTDCMRRTVQEEGMKALFKVTCLIAAGLCLSYLQSTNELWGCGSLCEVYTVSAVFLRASWPQHATKCNWTELCNEIYASTAW